MLDIVEDMRQFVVSRGTKHGYAGVAEMAYAFEQRRGSQMPSYVEYAPVFVYAVDAFAYLAAE